MKFIFTFAKPLCETKGEVDNCIKEHGISPIKLMDSLDMFECGTLAAHSVHVDEEDMAIMAAKHVRVAHNPQSNLKLASGIAPVPLALTAPAATITLICWKNAASPQCCIKT